MQAGWPQDGDWCQRFDQDGQDDGRIAAPYVPSRYIAAVWRVSTRVWERRVGDCRLVFLVVLKTWRFRAPAIRWRVVCLVKHASFGMVPSEATARSPHHVGTSAAAALVKKTWELTPLRPSPSACSSSLRCKSSASPTTRTPNSSTGYLLLPYCRSSSKTPSMNSP